MWPYDRESATTRFTRGYDNVMFWDGLSFGVPDYRFEKSGRRARPERLSHWAPSWGSSRSGRYDGSGRSGLATGRTLRRGARRRIRSRVPHRVVGRHRHQRQYRGGGDHHDTIICRIEQQGHQRGSPLRQHSDAQ